MMKRFAVIVACIGWLSVPLSAQWAVIDIAHVVQAVLLVERVIDQNTTLIQTYRRIVEMTQRLGGDLSRYRTPPILPSRHDVERYPYAAPLLTALNSGDGRGELYRQVVGRLPSITGEFERLLTRLPPEARRLLRAYYASLEIHDSVAERGIHYAAQARGFTGSDLEQAIQALELDVTHPRTAYHYPTAILDKLAGASIIDARQTVLMNQALSHALEQLLLRTKERRDQEANLLDLRLNALQVDPNGGILGGADVALQNWR